MRLGLAAVCLGVLLLGLGAFEVEGKKRSREKRAEEGATEATPKPTRPGAPVVRAVCPPVLGLCVVSTVRSCDVFLWWCVPRRMVRR
jgi:hypothetical protein